jgi:hypothetical protein
MDFSTTATSITLFCSYGTIQDIISFGIPLSMNSTCPQDQYTGIDMDADCNFNSMGQNLTDYIQKAFDEQCLGQVSCSFEVNQEMFNQRC